MRFAKDGSNIHEFAFFVGGTISTRVGPNPAIVMPDNCTYIHPGNYAISRDGRIEKMYKEDFENYFGYVEGLELNPIDTPYFFQAQQKSYAIKAILDEEKAHRMGLLARNASYAKLFKGRAARKVEENAEYQTIAKHLPNITFEELDALSYKGKVVFSDGTAAMLAFGPENKNERVLITGLTADEFESAQTWLNREMLLKGQYFMMMLDY